MDDIQNGLWVRQRNFVFDCVVRTLSVRISEEKDPLAVLAMASLFANLGDEKQCNSALAIIEESLLALPAVEDSTLQLRDCLLAAGYFYVSRQVARDTLEVEDVVLDRIRFAAARDWLGDSRLAMSVAALGEHLVLGAAARDYLRSKVQDYIQGNFLLGAIHCSIAASETHGQQLCDFVSAADWLTQDVGTLSWGLIGMEVLLRKGCPTPAVQRAVAELLVERIAESPLVRGALTPDTPARCEISDHLIPFDYALAAFALNFAGFDAVIGVPRSRQKALLGLLEAREELGAGGTVLSRRKLLAYDAAVLLLLLLLTCETARFVGLPGLAAVILEMLLLATGAAVLAWLHRDRRTIESAVRGVFGETIPKASGRRTGKNDHTA